MRRVVPLPCQFRRSHSNLAGMELKRSVRGRSQGKPSAECCLVHGLVERFGGIDLGPDTVSAKVFDSQASVLPGQGYHEGVCVILAPCQFRRSHSNL